MLRLVIVVGTRPQLIKLASVGKELDRVHLPYDIVHTGQHYDFEMDGIFFDELGLPEPVVNLGIGSGSHGWQTGNMLIKLEKSYLQLKPTLVVVPGDTNSALAGGLASVKMKIPVAHLEAGLRSRLPFMAEEVNRVLLDHLSHLLFAPTETAYNNLLQEGIDSNTVHLTGDVMADNTVLFKHKLDDVTLPIDFDAKSYVYVTIHRAENVDDPEKLKAIVQAIAEIPERHGLKAVFAVHPHTRKSLEGYGLCGKLRTSQIDLLKPVSYLESLRLARDACIVLTDSGGLQKESFLLGTPVVTLRETTEWVETVKCGWNILVNVDSNKINQAMSTFRISQPKPIDPLKFYGRGKASKNITKAVEEWLESIDRS